VHVRVEVSGRGSPGDMTVIYLLSSEGRQTWLEAQEQDILLGRAGHAELVTIDNDVSEIQRVSSCHFPSSR